MMRTILVPLADGIDGGPALDAALGFARRLKSHIRVLFARPDPGLALSYIPDAFVAAGLTREAIEREGGRAADQARTQFDAWQSGNGVPAMPPNHRLDACFASWSETVGEIEAVVTQAGRVSDLVAFSRFGAADATAGRGFDAAVFGCGRAVLLAPAELPWDIVDHVLIAWNGSLEASRAVFAAMPLLRAAGRVSIFAAREAEGDRANSAELAESLAWHGIRACRVAAPESGLPGPALLEAAKAREASLIVMGAYTHGRLRQSLLGGVTRHVLEHAAVPVLMAH